MITPTASAQPMMFEFVIVNVASPVKAEEQGPMPVSMCPTYALFPVCNIVVPQPVQFVAVAPATPTGQVEPEKMGAATRSYIGSSTEGLPESAPSTPEHGARWASTSSAACSSASDADFSACTTMAILNIPYAYPKWKLQADIEAEGLAYDYFHFPRDSRRGKNRGFAFVNFVTAEAAQAFYHAFHNRSLFHPGSEEKRIAVMHSSLQGFENNAQLNPSAVTRTTSTARSVACGNASRSHQAAAEDRIAAWRGPERAGRSRCFSRPGFQLA